jgi:tRNA modification GTPase
LTRDCRLATRRRNEDLGGARTFIGVDLEHKRRLFLADRTEALESVRDVTDDRMVALQRRRRSRAKVAALAGYTNAGKSSLFNALLGDDRAIVAARPGTTRDTLEEQFFLNDVPVTLTDTAGLRRAAGAAERAGVARARRALARAEVVLGVIDGSKNPGSPDRRLAAAWRRGRTILVLAKADRLKSAEARERREASWRRALAWGARPGLWISSRAGTGLPELRSEILEAAGVCGLGTASPE